MGPERVKVLPQTLTPLAATSGSRFPFGGVRFRFRGGVGFLPVFGCFRGVVEPPLFVVFNEGPKALARRVRSFRTIRPAAHEGAPRVKFRDATAFAQAPLGIMLCMAA
jgi:hypothetical protein